MPLPHPHAVRLLLSCTLAATFAVTGCSSSATGTSSAASTGKSSATVTATPTPTPSPTPTPTSPPSPGSAADPLNGVAGSATSGPCDWVPAQEVATLAGDVVPGIGAGQLSTSGTPIDGEPMFTVRVCSYLGTDNTGFVAFSVKEYETAEAARTAQSVLRNSLNDFTVTTADVPELGSDGYWLLANDGSVATERLSAVRGRQRLTLALSTPPDGYGTAKEYTSKEGAMRTLVATFISEVPQVS